MTPESSMAPPQETPQQAAARWFARRRSGAMTAQDLRDLESWLNADARHRGAYEHLARLWSGAEAARSDPEVMQMREAAVRAQARRRLGVLMLAAACLVAVCFAGAAVGNWMTAGNDASPALVAGPDHQEFKTGAGQTATMTLADGSVVTLDANTVLRTRATWNRRYAELGQGRAFFRVAKDPTRPFVVLAHGKTVTALGTSFEVLVDRERFEVTLVTGRVRVEAPSPAQAGEAQSKLQTTSLDPGTKLVGVDDRNWRLMKVDVEAQTSWVDGLLRFRDQPMGKVAAELNRYSDRKVVIRDPTIAARPIQGAFEAGDVDEFVMAVEAYELARVVSRTDTEIVLAAPQGGVVARAPEVSPVP